MSFLRAFGNGGMLALRSALSRSAMPTVLAAKPGLVQTSVQQYQTSSPKKVGAYSALYRFDFDPGHDIQHHWKLERYLATGLAIALPAGLYFQHPALDYTIAAIMCTHFYMGWDCVIFDYLHYRPRWLYWYCMAWLWFWTAVAFAGLCYYTYAKNGMCGALKELWTVHYDKKLL